MGVNIYQVDVFTHKAFGGNPAGVVPDARGLREIDMQNLAREMNLSETVFIIPEDEYNYRVRFFTPVSEVDLCGHGTIGAFYTLAHMGYISFLENGVKKIYQKTRAGRLAVEIYYRNGKVDKVLMEQAPPKDLGRVEDIGVLLEVFNIRKEDVGIENEYLSPRIISTGLPDIILPIRRKEVLDNLKIDFHKLSSLSKELKIVGVHAFHFPKKDSPKVYARNFAPLVGINEEAATGTANGALAYFLKKLGFIRGNKITALQGMSLNRPSSIFCEIEGDGRNCRIKVGGQAKIVLQGVMCF